MIEIKKIEFWGTEIKDDNLININIIKSNPSTHLLKIKNVKKYLYYVDFSKEDLDNLKSDCEKLYLKSDKFNLDDFKTYKIEIANSVTRTKINRIIGSMKLELKKPDFIIVDDDYSPIKEIQSIIHGVIDSYFVPFSKEYNGLYTEVENDTYKIYFTMNGEKLCYIPIIRVLDTKNFPKIIRLSEFDRALKKTKFNLDSNQFVDIVKQLCSNDKDTFNMACDILSKLDSSYNKIIFLVLALISITPHDINQIIKSINSLSIDNQFAQDREIIRSCKIQTLGNLKNYVSRLEEHRELGLSILTNQNLLDYIFSMISSSIRIKINV